MNMELLTNDDLINFSSEKMVFDIECYPNFFLIIFKHINSGKIAQFAKFEGQAINEERLRYILYHFELIAYNCNKYDNMLILGLLKGYDNTQLKDLSDRIIIQKLTPRALSGELGYCPRDWNIIDLIQLIPKDEDKDAEGPGDSNLTPSLKKMAGVLDSPWMQDLPFDPGTFLTLDQMKFVFKYCVNDINNTILVYNSVKHLIDLRITMGDRYGMDLRSKSDAQIAEAVIISEIEKSTGRKIPYPKDDTHKMKTKANFKNTTKIKFKSDIINKKLMLFESTNFTLSKNGRPILPDDLKPPITINGKNYKIGMGGLHSCEKKQTTISDENYRIIDVDVDSYYPTIIINQRLYPEQCGEEFLNVYSKIKDDRIEAKRREDTVTSQVLKIVVNGGFGKFGSSYSRMYNPDLMLQTTISGQFSLLMLIEAYELSGIEVISANTDGVTCKVHRNKEELHYKITKSWEKYFNWTTETNYYKGLYQRDVNNYIAIYESGKIKKKGCFADFSLAKSPNNKIIYTAFEKFINEGIPMEKTISECKDITKFITVRKVGGGGAMWNGEFIGKVVRFYHSNESDISMSYKKSGNKVPDSENSRPIMNLESQFPSDVDIDYYIEKANSLLYVTGIKRKFSKLF